MDTGQAKPPEIAYASLIGRSLGGFEVISLIGRGAAGTVYLAWDPVLRRHVAVKALLGGLARNPSLVRSLQLEAKAAAPLRHPNIVRIYSAGVEAGTPYIAMEYVEGEPLDRFLKRVGRLQWIQAFYIGLQIAEALRYTHTMGVIHRDVKPANVLLDRQGRVRLTDFGIANIQKQPDLAEASGFLGTPHYMSPEQCEGREVTAASDLYSLGVTLYQMIAGDLPFTADSPMALVKSITTDPIPRLNRLLPDVPDDVARLVAHLLEKRAEARPQDAEIVCRTMVRLQQENGGKSALPSALNAFIREQAKIPSAPTPLPEKGDRRSATPAPRKARTPYAQRAWFRAVVATLFVLACAVPPALAWARSPLHGQAHTAPTLDTFSFSRQGRSQLARLQSNGYRAASVDWAGPTSVVMVKAEGRPGSSHQGATGVLAVDIGRTRAWSVRAPAGSPFYTAKPRLHLLSAHPAVSFASESTPLGAGFLVGATDPAESATGALLVQRYRESSPRADVVYQGAPVLCAVPHPGGYKMALVLLDESGGSYLAERDVRWIPNDRLGPRISPLSSSVVPESVAYSPDGNFLAFVLDREAEGQEVWIASSGGDSSAARLLLAGRFAAGLSFSPDGKLLAVTQVGEEEDEDAQVALIDVRRGEAAQILGPGRIGRSAWHPSGRYLVVTAPENSAEAAKDGLYALQVAAPHKRIALFDAGFGIVGTGAVSVDGRWAVAALNDRTSLTLVFADLRTVAFGEL